MKEIIQKTGKFDKDFDGIKWVIDVRSTDVTRQNINGIKIDGGLVIATDGHRLHTYMTERELPDGTYTVVSATGKVIVLESNDYQFPDYKRVFPSVTHAGIPDISTPADKSEKDNRVVNTILKKSDMSFNIRYLSDACPCDEDLEFRQSDTALVINNKERTKSAIVMALNYTYEK